MKRISSWHFLQFIFYLQIFFTSCRNEESVYNPCLKHYQTEDFRPSNVSLSWAVFLDHQNLIFENENGEQTKFTVTTANEITESLKSLFIIVCPEDSFQTSEVNYKTFEYLTICNKTEGKTSLNAILVHLDVILDELHSNLDKVKLADIVNIDFRVKPNGSSDSTTTRILEFPVLERGYKDALSAAYLHLDSIQLNHQVFYDVYYNYDNSEQLKVYYSRAGLLAFQIDGELFVKKP